MVFWCGLGAGDVSWRLKHNGGWNHSETPTRPWPTSSPACCCGCRASCCSLSRRRMRAIIPCPPSPPDADDAADPALALLPLLEYPLLLALDPDEREEASDASDRAPPSSLSPPSPSPSPSGPAKATAPEPRPLPFIVLPAPFPLPFLRPPDARSRGSRRAAAGCAWPRGACGSRRRAKAASRQETETEGADAAVAMAVVAAAVGLGLELGGGGCCCCWRRCWVNAWESLADLWMSASTSCGGPTTR